MCSEDSNYSILACLLSSFGHWFVSSALKKIVGLCIEFTSTHRGDRQSERERWGEIHREGEKENKLIWIDWGYSKNGEMAQWLKNLHSKSLRKPRPHVYARLLGILELVLYIEHGVRGSPEQAGPWEKPSWWALGPLRNCISIHKLERNEEDSCCQPLVSSCTHTFTHTCAATHHKSMNTYTPHTWEKMEDNNVSQRLSAISWGCNLQCCSHRRQSFQFPLGEHASIQPEMQKCLLNSPQIDRWI